MREILFRGKRLDNRKFVEGFYSYHRRSMTDPEYQYIMVGDGFGFSWFAVDATTVGQYTGLKDKNGKRIFEGDMLKPFDDDIDKMVVMFNYGQFLLCLYGERGYMGESGWIDEGNYGVIECEPLSSYGEDIEVIGNIYDNPELLEGGGTGEA